MRKISLRTPSKCEIKGETVFGGNNFIFCMKGRKNSCCICRCFGGDRPDRLIIATLLINIPGIFFAYYVAFPVSEIQ